MLLHPTWLPAPSKLQGAFSLRFTPIPNPILSWMRDVDALLPVLLWAECSLKQTPDGEVDFSTTGGADASRELHGAENGFDERTKVDAVVNSDVIEEIGESCARFESGDGVDLSAHENGETEEFITVADGSVGVIAVEKLVATVSAKTEGSAEREFLEEARGVAETCAERCATKDRAFGGNGNELRAVELELLERMGCAGRVNDVVDLGGETRAAAGDVGAILAFVDELRAQLAASAAGTGQIGRSDYGRECAVRDTRRFRGCPQNSRVLVSKRKHEGR